MYDELVKRLRNRRICIQQSGNLDDFPLLKEAADAIQELSMKLHGDEAAIAGMKREIEHMVVSGSKPRWIPVTERLPEEYVNVLVWLRSIGRDSFYYSIDHLMEDGQWWKAANSWKHEVTHWMPLPEPPKEGA